MIKLITVVGFISVFSVVSVVVEIIFFRGDRLCCRVEILKIYTQMQCDGSFN